MAQWARFQHRSKIGFGNLDADAIRIHAGDLFGTPTPTGETVALADVELLTPVEPSKVVALAHNFHTSIEKSGGSVPAEPLYFFKSTSSLHPTGKPIRRPAGYEGKIIFEGELGLVIGKPCQNVTPQAALEYLFGCTCINDVTAIGILNENPDFQQWTRCKAADTFGVVGPVVATDLDPASLTVRALLDGTERQNYPITDMVFSAAELISRISRDMRLLPGDVIACGTNVGVGSMKPGSTIEISIEGIGSLINVFDP